MRLPGGSRRRGSPPAAKSAGLLTVSGQSSSSSLPRPATRLPGQDRAVLLSNGVPSPRPQRGQLPGVPWVPEM
eukprot:5317727-Lingulodinium_polyedra.AAC.1